MKSSSKNPGTSASEVSLQDLTTSTVETLDDPKAQAIEALEARLFRSFGEIEGELDEWERKLVAAVRRTIEDIRVENVESMEAVQLDLEVLRHKLSSSTDLPSVLKQLYSANCIEHSITLDTALVKKLISDRVQVNYRLPSTCVKTGDSELVSASGECLLFDTPSTSTPDPHPRPSSPRKTRVGLSKPAHPQPPFPLSTRLVIATLYAVSVGVFVHAALTTYH